MNYAVQAGSIHALLSKGHIDQVTGAGAESLNKSRCGCDGKQVAKATSKNVSFQSAKIGAGLSFGSITQSAVSTASAKNIRGGGRR
jgi:hypothetical protein